MSHQSPVTIHDPVHDSIASEMKTRMGEYSQKVQIDVFVGTYNLNGKPPSGESLDSWLRFDKGMFGHLQYYRKVSQHLFTRHSFNEYV